MAGRGYLRGLLLALAWLIMGLTVLYLTALLAGEANMESFCLLWGAAWPCLAGFYAGWRDERAGFGAGARAVLPALLLLAAAWWWLLPQLWSAALCAKAAVYVLISAALCGGAGAGLKKARQKLYPPPQDDGEI